MKIQPPHDPQKKSSPPNRAIDDDDDLAGQRSARLLELRRDLVEHDRLMQSLLHRVEVTNKILAGRQDLLAKARLHLEALHLALIRQQQECDALLSSRSWKITAPLRIAGRVLRKVGNAVLGTRPDTENASAANEGENRPGESSRHGGIDLNPSSDSVEILRRTLEETLGPADNKVAEARYVHRTADRLNVDKVPIRVIAFYVPEFHEESRNRELRTLGLPDPKHFTRALPRYLGHYQPHLPADLGLNDQRVPELTRAQVELARQYGIRGFCFLSYWSSVGLVPNEPLDRFLKEPGLDLQFCICCASAGLRYGAGESGATVTQWPRDDVLIGALGPALADPRYIRVDGKPVLIICHADRVPDIRTRVPVWRKKANSMGLGGLYLVWMGHAADEAAADFDAILEDPLDVTVSEATSEYVPIDSGFRGRIYDYEALVEEQRRRRTESGLPVFRNVMTGWDSEPRDPRAGKSFAGSSPASYARWLDWSCGQTMRQRPEERLLFVSAWNNWPEGAHLEPDRRFGYAYLHTTANVLRYYHQDPATDEWIAKANAAFSPSSDVAIIFHCYYEDLIPSIFDRYLAKDDRADLFVTLRYDVSEQAVREMRSKFPRIYFFREENRGRDIRPFLIALRHIRALGYRLACKIHTKKTPQAMGQSGEVWRQQLIEPLLGCPDSATRAAEIFTREPALGLLVPKGSVMDLTIEDNHTVNTHWLDHFLDRMDRRDLVGRYNVRFPAGSMYWVRLEALAGFEEMLLTPDEFEFELGQRDGTVAHAVERLVALYVQERGYRMRETAGLVRV